MPDRLTGDPGRLPQSFRRLTEGAERPYRPRLRPPPGAKQDSSPAIATGDIASPATLAAMPSPAQNFDGLARTDLCGGSPCGSGIPPDANGDVGPNHYVQAVNDAYAELC
jgi:hypothetical protein